MDVFRQRLEDEYDANVIITAPTVPYKGAYGPILSLFAVTNWHLVVYRDRAVFISNPTEFPELSDASSKVLEVQTEGGGSTWEELAFDAA